MIERPRTLQISDFVSDGYLHVDFVRLMSELALEHNAICSFNKLAAGLVTDFATGDIPDQEYIKVFNGTANITISNLAKYNPLISIIQFGDAFAAKLKYIDHREIWSVTDLLQVIYWELNKRNSETYKLWVKYFASNIHPENFMLMAKWAGVWCVPSE